MWRLRVLFDGGQVGDLLCPGCVPKFDSGQGGEFSRRSQNVSMCACNSLNALKLWVNVSHRNTNEIIHSTVVALELDQQ